MKPIARHITPHLNTESTTVLQRKYLLRPPTSNDGWRNVSSLLSNHFFPILIDTAPPQSRMEPWPGLRPPLPFEFNLPLQPYSLLPHLSLIIPISLSIFSNPFSLPLPGTPSFLPYDYWSPRFPKPRPRPHARTRTYPAPRAIDRLWEAKRERWGCGGYYPAVSTPTYTLCGRGGY